MKIFNRRNYAFNLISRILIIIIFLLGILILNKFNKPLVLKFKNNLFNKSFNFIKVNKISQKFLGKDVFYYHDNGDITEVLSNSFSNNEKEMYYDAEKLYVSDNLPIGSISNGVVVYEGNKDNYGNTIIIQGMDGFNIWYANIKDISPGLYDYVEKNNLIGAADGDYIYLIIEKNNKYYTYDEYIQNKN